jgi:hypothetical protein
VFRGLAFLAHPAVTVLAVAGAAPVLARTAADPNRLFACSKVMVRDRFSDEIVDQGVYASAVAVAAANAQPFIMLDRSQVFAEQLDAFLAQK